jgi:predicted transcriptional regulator
MVSRRDPVRRALIQVLDRIPFSLRELARRAGISHSTLILAREGKIHLSEDHRKRVVKALREMSGEIAKLADQLEGK